MAKRKRHEDYREDSTMQELHQIREEFDRQQRESGLSYFEWLQATEADMHKSLAEVGFEIVTRGGRTFIDEIKPRSKKNVAKAKTGKARSFKSSSHSSPSETPKYMHDDDYIEDSTGRELQTLREDRTSSDNIEPPSQKKSVKYKTTIKRRTKNSRKK